MSSNTGNNKFASGDPYVQIEVAKERTKYLEEKVFQQKRERGNVNGNIFRAIIFTIISIVVTTMSWLVISLSGTKIGWFYFFPFFGAIVSLAFSVIVIFQKESCMQKSYEYHVKDPTRTEASIKITFNIDNAPVLLETPDVESAAKLLERLQVSHPEPEANNIYDIPGLP